MNKKFFAFIIPAAAVFSASFFASSLPDTLERVAVTYGFLNKTKRIFSFFSGYSFPFIENNHTAVFTAGLAGLAVLYILFKIMSNIIIKYMEK